MDAAQVILPPEIFSLIIGHLGQNGAVEPLQVSALVCRSFLGFSRRHIFAHVSINTDQPSCGHQAPPISILRFVNILLKAPHIGRYIQKLTYNVAPEDADVPNVVDALKTLGNLSVLELDYAHVHFSEGPQTLAWKTSPLRPGLAYLLSRPTLRALRLGAIDGLSITDLCLASNLKTLCITDDLVPTEIIPEGSLRLHALCFTGKGTRGIHSAIASLRSDGTTVFDARDLISIEGVVLDDNRNELASIFFYVFEHATDLSSLRLSFLDSCRGLYGQLLPTDAFKTISLLDFSIYYYLGLDIIDPYLGLCAELEKLTNNNKIEEIIITISLPLELVEGCFGRPPTEWMVLDKLLTSKGWPCLKKVGLYYNVRFPRVQDLGSQTSERIEQFAQSQRDFTGVLKAIIDAMKKSCFRQLFLSNTITLNLGGSTSSS